jgi:hypothetical protein
VAKSAIAKHLAIIVGVAALLALLMLYPFLPGQYDRLATPLSIMAQAFGVAGALLVPVGIAWLVYELRSARREKRRRFALAALVVGIVVALVVSLIGAASGGASVGALALSIAFFVALPALNKAKNAERGSLCVAPLYLIALPIFALVFQLALIAPITEWSRNRALAQSAEFIRDIERYATSNGSYPASLPAIWPDYETGVVGVERYVYAQNGEAYDVLFEQPRFLLDRVGTREFVMYNPRDEHALASHTYAILHSTPAEQSDVRGWYESGDAGAPHWRYFLFD